MSKEYQKFVVSQKGMIVRDSKCLIVQIAETPGNRASQKWEMPGGRIDEGEEWLAAFKREMFEEVGLKDFKILGLADCNVKYEEGFLPYCGLLYLLEIRDDEQIELTAEHCEAKWITEGEVNDYDYIWKKMPEMIKKGFELCRMIKK